MFLPERYRRNPPQRRPSPPASSTEPAAPDTDALPRPAEFEEREPNAWDEADELAAMSDADFYQQLRQDIAGVKEGSVPSVVDAMRPPLKDRPWGKRHKRRDKHGQAF